MSPAQSVKRYLLDISNDRNALLQFVTELHRDFAGTLTSRWPLSEWQIKRLAMAPMGMIAALLASVQSMLKGQYHYAQPHPEIFAGFEEQTAPDETAPKSLWLGNPLELQLLTRAVARVLMPVLDENMPFGYIRDVKPAGDVMESEFLSINRNEVRSSGIATYTSKPFNLPATRGKRIAGKFIIPDRTAEPRTIVLLPPMKGLWTDYSLLVGVLLQRGFTVVVFDGHGHGENIGLIAPSFSEYFEDFKTVTSYARDCAQANIGIVGCSLGGMMALNITSSVPGVIAVVAEGVSIASGVGIANLIRAEHPLVSNYYGGLLSASGRMLKRATLAQDVQVLLAWGERDPVVHKEERRKTLEFLQSRMSKLSWREVSNGAHFLPFGFPMQPAVIGEYLNYISDHFKNALS
ncbi:MAG TPA: alpha/beta fold hydrolase [Candidatus Kapabacteria bacterium]|jgi:pimeloyl-ACP methyl ester carboxylesterase|nr:alpha/beta fold hydrolase [Candidatus Kapabacteria bacterium]